MPRKNHICPGCGSRNTVKIIYGMPSFELEEKASKGEVVHGGCCIMMDDPTRHCKDCNYSWGNWSGRSIFHDMKTIEASIGGFFGPSCNVTVDKDQGFISYHFSQDGYEIPGIAETKELSDEVWNKLVNGLVQYDVEYWLDEYVDATILDGTSWSAEIELYSGEKIIKSGSNRFPGTWKQFCKLITRLTGNTFR